MYLHVYYLYTHKDKHLYIDCYIIVISLYISVTREKFICVLSHYWILQSVQKYTDAIKIIHLQDVEVEELRKVKNVDWLATPKYPGIQKPHLWLKETCNDEVHCLTAKTADRPLTEVRIMKQKNKGSNENKKSKIQK